MTKFLEIVLDKFINDQSAQNGKTGWKEPPKKLTEKITESHKIYIKETCDICDNLFNNLTRSCNNTSIVIYNESGFLDDKFRIYKKIIDQKIYEVYESRIKTSMYMNISINNDMPKLLKVTLFL